MQHFYSPVSAVETRIGLDMARFEEKGGKTSQRIILLGQRRKIDGKVLVEVLGGLEAGDKVLLP